MIKYYMLDSKNNIVTTDDIHKWDKWLENIENRIVARTELAHFDVSTIFLGLDHGFNSARPVLFETMVFKKGTVDEVSCKRYCTLKEAKKEHKKMVKKWENR